MDKVIFDLDSLQTNKHMFKGEMLRLRKEILEDFSKRNDKCEIILNGNVFETTLNVALVNLILLQFFVDLGIKIVEDDLYKETIATAGLFKDYANHCLDRFIEHQGTKPDYNAFKETYQGVNDSLNRCVDFNINYGTNFSLYDFIQIAAEGGEGAKLFKPEIPSNLTFTEVEELQDKYAGEMMSYIMSRPDLDLYQFGVSKTGINKNQFRQLCCFVGLKPDMFNGILPKVVTDNYLYGINSEEFYYMNCIGARKAMCINYKNVRQSGYITRILDTSVVDVVHNPDNLDCGTKHYVKMKVNTMNRLIRLNGRHYYEISEEGIVSKELKTINYRDSESKQLIGKTIALRSPVKCSAEGEICATCYGRELAEKNRYVHAGIIANKMVMHIIMQLLLSAKHFLQTNSIKIDFPELYLNVFDVDLDVITFKESSEYSIELHTSDGNYSEEEDRYCYRVVTFVHNETGERISTVSPVELFLNPDIVIKDDVTIIEPNSELEYIFEYFIENEEITRALQDIISIFESSDHLGIDNIDELINKFCELTEEDANLDHIHIVHAECLLYKLVVDPVTLKRPKFNKAKHPDYKIITASQSNMNGPLSRSLSFERIGQQLSTLSTYDKDEKSFLDHMYK